MRAKVRAVDRTGSTAMWHKRMLILFAALMLCASTVFGMGQSALAAPAGGDETYAEDAPSEPTPSVDPTSPASGEATATPTPAATTPAATDAPAAAESPATATTAPTLINPEGAKGPSALVGPEALVTPLTVGTPDGGVAPYVYWDTRDADDSSLRGGATYELQGPRTSSSGLFGIEYNVSWNSSVTVTDCVAATCAGPDLDPDPGEFLVKKIGTHNISSSNRYRVRQVTPPTGYNFTDSSNGWKEIPGSRNTPTGWSGSGTYDFGDFRVRKIPSKSPICEAGYVYGIRKDGQIVQVAPGGTVTTLGSNSANGSSFNGLGIGTNGSPVYAYSRSGSGNNEASDSRPRIYVYNVQDGKWSSTGVRVPEANTSNVTFVAGAVDLKTGKYYLGGFNNDGKQFRIWEYAGSGNPVFKGYINTSTNSGGSNNGDLAFNSNGDMFVVRGSDSQTTVFSVTAEALATATGSSSTPIPSSFSRTVTTMSDVNGVAFDSSGKVFLGAGSDVRSYDMPNWSGSTSVTSSLASGSNTSTDLATCSSPATITIEKYVQGARVNNGDQFKLELKQGTQLLGTATTTGNQPNVQAEHIGPQPTARGVTLTFTESAAGTTDVNKYASSWSCEVDGEPLPGASGSGKSGSVTIPARGESVVCRFTNAPLVANVKVSKLVTDALGENPQPKQGWTVNAEAAATADTVTSDPSGSTPQQTNSSGSAAWNLAFGSTNSRAKVTVSEEPQDGYEFQGGQCVIAHLDGTVSEADLNGPDRTELAGIAPGDSVDCTYVNKLIPDPKLTLKKEVVNPATGSGYAVATDWTLTAKDEEGDPTISGVSGNESVTGQEVPAGTYNLTEQFSSTPDKSAGYEWTNLQCVDGAGGEVVQDVSITDGVVTSASVTLQSTSDVTCTFTNTAKRGMATWSKVAEGSDSLLSGSEWKLTGPDAGTVAPITDNIGDPNYSGLDKDPAAGKFKLEGLAWGDYTLVETKAPAGYRILEDPIAFNVGPSSPAQLSWDLGPIDNEQREGPNLPLTGGRSTDAILIGGGILVLAAAAAGIIQKRRKA